MEVDPEPPSEGGGAKGNPMVVLLVGAPGSGKSTFCDHVMRSSTRQWARICQDTIGNGKAGTKNQCLQSAASALKDGKSIFIDRCNLNKEQRLDFVKLGGPQIYMHALVLDLPAKLCISRSVKRTGHEGNLQGGKAAVVVNRMLQNKEWPTLAEGFCRITHCQSENDVQAAINTYSSLGPLDTLPSGCFGQKKQDTKIQLGIMRFLKKVDVPVNAGSDANSSQDIVGNDTTKNNNLCSAKNANDSPLSVNAGKEKKGDTDPAVGCTVGTDSLDSIPTLAFPSLSTADFQFDLEKASDIIVEKVEEYLAKLGNIRLVLVDLSRGSKILSSVRAKSVQKNIDPKKFLTFVGDITQLHSKGGLTCNVIANAANWRLRPGGGGVNAAIFSAAGPTLESATKKQAGSLMPGKAVVVPLSPTSPLYSQEGVTHVIHILGPNMNPQRPNFLNNDYIKGCQVLREAYTSLFEGFASIVMRCEKLSKESGDQLDLRTLESQGHCEKSSKKQFSDINLNVKRLGGFETEGSKKCKEFKKELGPGNSNPTDGKDNSKREHIDESTSKAWSSWTQALYHIAMQPERHKNEFIELSDDVVILNDLYPKAKRHILVLARPAGLDCLADVRREHLQILRTMHTIGLKWAEKFLSEDESLVFRLGYHSSPSMRQLHLHVISQDFDSKHLKNKKHWNSFNSPFFRDSTDVIEEIDAHGKATLEDDKLLSMELRCHRCRSAHPNIPRLKSHISNCRAAFPAILLQNGRLVSAASKTSP